VIVCSRIMVYTQLNFHCLFSSAQSRLAKSFFFKKHKLCQKRKEYTQHHVLCKENLLLSLSLQQSFQYHWKTCYLLSRPISDDLSSRDQILKKSLSTFQPFTYVSNERYLINEMCIEGFSQRLELRIDQHWNGWMPKILPKNYDIQRIFWSIIDCTNASAWLVLCQIMVVRIYTSLNYFIFWFISMHWLVIVHIFCHVEK